MPEGAPPAKFLPAYFLDIVKKGEEFAPGQLPAHVTTFPPIAEEYRPELGEHMRIYLNRMRPFSVVTGIKALIGDDETAPARMIDPSPQLQRVHDELVRVLGNLHHDPQYRQPYRPHVTLNGGINIPEGEILEVGGISIVQKFKGGSWTVVDKIGLKGEGQ